MVVVYKFDSEGQESSKYGFWQVFRIRWFCAAAAVVKYFRLLSVPRGGRFEVKMIKGAQKRVVVVKVADSNIFEEAYFVLKRDKDATGGDMAREAGRIIESLDPTGAREKVKRARELKMKIALILCGMGSGALLTAIFSGIAVLLGG